MGVATIAGKVAGTVSEKIRLQVGLRRRRRQCGEDGRACCWVLVGETEEAVVEREGGGGRAGESPVVILAQLWSVSWK